MQETIEKLKNEIHNRCNAFVYWNRADLFKDIKPLLPEIQDFILQFIQTEDIGVEKEIKLSMNEDMLGILNDLAESIEKGDSVLLYDTLESGLIEYLGLFVAEEE